jgi:hypothetical protein
MLALALLYAYDPATTALFPSCPFRMMTGLLCPLCGTLRAAHALLHGHVVDAFLFNPLTFTSGVAWVIAIGVAPELPAFAKPSARPPKLACLSASGGGKLGPTAAAVGVIVFTVARNVL